MATVPVGARPNFILAAGGPDGGIFVFGGGVWKVDMNIGLFGDYGRLPPSHYLQPIPHRSCLVLHIFP